MKNNFYYYVLVLSVMLYKIGWVIWWFNNPDFTLMQVVRKALLVFGD